MKVNRRKLESFASLAVRDQGVKDHRVPLEGAETLLEICRWRAKTQPNDVAYTFLNDGETEELNLTYGELDSRARAIAAALQEQGARGDRALLIYEPGLDYITAFFGCIYAGTIAVPVYPPDPLRMDRTLSRLQAIRDDAQATTLLCTVSGRNFVQALAGHNGSFDRLIATDELYDAPSGGWREPSLLADDLAFLQYTSGSTGMPKGVMVSHSNLVYNVSQIDRGEAPHGTVGVTWLPTYHDFGLIGAVILPMYSGKRTISMSPLAFVQRPVRWLQAITRYQGTFTGAPNFAFEMCVRKTTADEIAELDLRSLDVVLNGAEPVRQETLERFAETFGPCGFRREAMVSCYGLAEATLGVTGGDYLADGPRYKSFVSLALTKNRAVEAKIGELDCRALVSSGEAIQDTEVLIVDPHELTACPAGQVGEIWVQGPGVAQGYWNKPVENERTFRAFLADTKAGPYLRTGDLGFFYDDELYVTGRLKDMIIVAGRNHYPQDIERTVQNAHPALKLDSCAAFALDVEGSEQLVVVQEVVRPKRLNLEEILNDIRRAIALEHEIPLYAVVLIQAGTISKTTSGKIQRHASRDRFLADQLQVVGQWRASDAKSRPGSLSGRTMVAPSTPTETTLAGLWREVLGTEQFGVTDNFFDFGGHSLLATQLWSRIRAVLGVDLPLHVLFTSPTIAGQATEIDRVLLTQPCVARASIPHVEHGGTSPLSFGQQRLWFIDEWVGGEPLNNLCVASRFDGELDCQVLEWSLAEISRRHEVLRATFHNFDGQPVQRISASMPVAFKQVDLSAFHRADREAELETVSTAFAKQPFDLATGPLWRSTLVTLGTGQHVLLIGIHHIISDGWSLGVLLRELLLLYQARSLQDPSPLPELDVQYADYARWQRELLNDERIGRQMTYWRRQLGGRPTVLSLPTDRPRPSVQSFRGACERCELPASLVQQLEALGRAENATLFMTLLAGWQTLLHRFSGETDVLVGTAVAGRTQPELEPLIGFFVNTLVMRGDLRGDPTFRELLARTRETALEAYDHQDVPFERLIEELAPRREMSHTPLFQVSLVLHNAPLGLPNSAFSLREIHNGTSKYELSLSFWKEADRLVGTLEYNTGLFDAATIQRLLGAFQLLLTAAVRTPDASIDSLSVVSDIQRQHMLVDWNQTAAPYRDNACIHELFEEQVRRSPDFHALEFEGSHLTYAELNARANQLARHLRSLQVGPDVLVAICLERSPEMLIGVLGILKAGGAYVPLDPAYPASRLEYMLEDSGARILITQSSLADRFGKHDLQRFEIDVEGATLDALSTSNLPATPGASSLAYVIYTSGSTGTPKGVLIEHRSLCNMAAALAEPFGFVAESRVLQFASLCFDASVGEIFPTLSYGGTLCLTPKDMLGSGADFVALLQEQRISAVILPPSFLAALPLAPLPHLQTLIVAGEPCPAKLIERWAVGRRIVNGYGPTESTVCVTVFDCSADGRTPPLGRPVTNVQLYLLDERLQPVPLGVAGEIYIGGAGLARGYLNRPELNAEKFITVSLGDGPAVRLYKTGDMSRCRSDGNLEYLGRRDHQVKVRGHRIELGEIECALGQHPGIHEVVVVAREIDDSDKRLVAYFVAASEPAPGASEFREFLKTLLPEPLIPTSFVQLASLPVSPNGKVDRSALPAPDNRRPDLSESFVAPRTPAEETLARIWCEVIGLERIGIHDNFFDLGGDSLLTMRVVTRANQSGLKLSPRQMFEHQTVAEQAAVAGQGRVILAEQGPVVGDVPLTPIQHWFLDSDPIDPEHFNQSVMLDIKQSLDPDVLRAAIAELLVHHDVLRTRVVRTPTGWAQTIVAPQPDVPLECIDLSSLDEAAQTRELETSAALFQTTLCLAAGPLVRFALFDLGQARGCRLLLVAHHMVIDAVSWRIVLEDLHLLHGRLERHETPALLPKTTSFQDWSRRLTASADSETFREDAAYWREALPPAAVPPAADRLPRDVEATGTLVQNDWASSERLTVALEQDQTRALVDRLPRAYGAQMNELLLTALARAFTAWTNSDSLLVNIEGHGREDLFDDIDLSRTVGWFTSLFPVRLLVPKSTPLGEAVEAVRSQWARVPKRGLGFGVLRYLSADAQLTSALRALPAPEVSFNYLGQADRLFDGHDAAALARESAGSPRSPRQLRAHLLEINCVISQSRLEVEWTYCRHVHRQGTIQRVADAFLEVIRELIAAGRTIEARAAQTNGTPLAAPALSAADARSESPLVAIQPRGSKRPLFFVHPTGGNVFPYYGLAHQLGNDQPFYGLRARGMAAGETPHCQIEPMATDYLEAVRTVQPHGPYNLGGWSFGGLVAYEMARQLRAQGEQVEFLGLLDTRSVTEKDDERGESGFAMMAAMFPDVSQASLVELQRLSRAEQIAYFVRQAEAAQIILPGTTPDEAERLFEVFQGNSRAWLAYRPQPSGLDLHFFQPAEEDSQTCDELRIHWERLSRHLVVREVPGSHVTMVRQPHVRVLAEQVRASLDDAHHQGCQCQVASASAEPKGLYQL